MYWARTLALAFVLLGTAEGESQTRHVHFPIYDEFTGGCPASCSLECRYGSHHKRYDAFQFVCNSTSRTPQFRMDNQVLATTQGGVTIHGRRLQIEHITPAHRGVYRCFDTNPSNHGGFIMRKCTCLFTWKTEADRQLCYPTPVIFPHLTDKERHAKKDVVARVGESVTFHCPHEKPFTSDRSYVNWLYNDTAQLQMYTRNDFYTLPSVTEADAGTYACHVVQTLRYKGNATMMFTLTVKGPLPKQMSSPVQLDERTVTWQCPKDGDLHGLPVLNYKVSVKTVSKDTILEKIHIVRADDRSLDVAHVLSTCEACSVHGTMHVTIQAGTADGYGSLSPPITLNVSRGPAQDQILQLSLMSVGGCPQSSGTNGTIRMTRLRREVLAELSRLVERTCRCCDVIPEPPHGGCHGQKNVACSLPTSLQTQAVLRVRVHSSYVQLLRTMAEHLATTANAIRFSRLWEMDVVKICVWHPGQIKHDCRSLNHRSSFLFLGQCQFSSFNLASSAV